MGVFLKEERFAAELITSVEAAPSKNKAEAGEGSSTGRQTGR